MKDYLIYLDVAGDIDPVFAKENDVRFIPMNYMLGDEEFICKGMEDDDFMHTFYQRIREGDMTHTSQITPQKYIDLFAPLMAEGKDILYICLSSGLTKTFDSALLAKNELEEEYPNAKFIPVDSLAASAGMGLLVEMAVKYKKQGMSIDEAAAVLEEMKYKICHLFMVEDLMYLKRGGRVSATTAVVGTMLNIKPILCIDNEGKLPSIDKKRGAKMALKEIIRRMKKSLDPEYHHIYILHGDAPDRAAQLEKMIKEADPMAEVTTVTLCPVIGSHTGPDMAAVIYVGDRDKAAE